jgi:DNA (cytosine-5)-methyltransferase 1
MRHGSLFSGIGGFDLAAEWMGWENVFHCEWMEFPRKVLEYYWPEADSHIDICKTDFKKYANRIDILTGGFPCQPFSLAGKRKGKDDERYLWGEMLRAIQEIKPTWVIAENVFGITNIDGGLVFEQVCIDLENEGYEVQPFIIPAAAKNAPHRRDRCWFVAYRDNSGCEHGQIYNRRCEKKTRSWEISNIFSNTSKSWNATDTNSTSTQCRNCETTQRRENKRRRIEPLGFNMEWEKFPTQSPVCGGNDGLPTELDGITFSKWRNESIKGYGNAICPQIAYELFKIIQHEHNK